MWGEVHKSPNMVALYHFNEAYGGGVKIDAMGNYDMTSGSNVSYDDALTKVKNALFLDPPSTNDNQGDIYTTATSAKMNYQDVENLRTFGAWCFPTYVNNVYSGYRQEIVYSKGGTYLSFDLFKLGHWTSGSPGSLDNTFSFGYAVRVWEADNTHAIVSFTTNQDYSFNKPYFLMVVYKPSSAGTNDGWIDFYINFIKVDRRVDPGSVVNRWTSIYSESSDRYLYIGTPGNNPKASNIFEGRIDEVFLSKDALTNVQINNMNVDWKNSFTI